VRILTAPVSTKMRFETRLTGLRLQALRWLRTSNRASTVISHRTPCMGFPPTAPDGFQIPFSDGHTRSLPRLTCGPFRYMPYADSYPEVAIRYAHVRVKQAVISPSALSLVYPAERVPDYAREQFIDDLLREHETKIRRCGGS
jgi:hypothetical protein